VFRRLRPTSCPSCDTEISPSPGHAAPGHSCSLCGQDADADADGSSERISGLKLQVTEASKTKASIAATLQSNRDELEICEARVKEAEQLRSASMEILSKDDAGREVDVRLIGISAKIQVLQESLPPEPTGTINSSDAQILKAAEHVTRECYSEMQLRMLEHFSKELFRIATDIGVENLQSVDVKPNKIEITQGKTLTTFGKLNPGEILRFRTAAALAAVATAKWSGVGRHPGFIVLDSPAAQEMSGDDFAALLTRLSDVVDEHEDMQVIVGALMRPIIKDVVPCSRMEYAQGDAHLF
jgi:hypothetical protein